MNKKTKLKLFLLFIPVAYATYLFHEFGHWIVGEILGNDMVFSLNYVWPKNGSFVHNSHALYSSIGGPAFTILQSIIFLIIIEKHRLIYAYPFVFFAFFIRFFSLVFGGFNLQDEAAISTILHLGKFTVAIIVLLILFLSVWRASRLLKFDFKMIGFLFTMSTLSILLVIATYEFML